MTESQDNNNIKHHGPWFKQIVLSWNLACLFPIPLGQTQCSCVFSELFLVRRAFWCLLDTWPLPLQKSSTKQKQQYTLSCSNIDHPQVSTQELSKLIVSISLGHKGSLMQFLCSFNMRLLPCYILKSQMERYKILNWYGNTVYGMEKTSVSKTNL